MAAVRTVTPVLNPLRKLPRPSKVVGGWSAAVIAAILAIIALIWFTLPEPVAPPPPPTVAAQVLAASSGTTLSTLSAQSPLMETKAVSYTEFLDTIHHTFPGAPATINSASSTAALAAGPVIYTTKFLSAQTEQLSTELTRAKANIAVVPLNDTSAVSRAPEPSPWTVLLPVLIIMLVGGGISGLVLWKSSSGRSTAAATTKKPPVVHNSKLVAERPEVRFADVGGVDEAVEDLTEIVSFLHEPDRFTRVGANAPAGVLLVGPPGTGKTMLARAVAGEAGVPFYSAAGPDFTEMYVGVGPKRIRELFAAARSHPEGAIIFIDEIDAIGRARSSAESNSSNTESENTLNALLVELDGFHKSTVVILAATNREDILDKALTRPGRFDRTVQVPLPDRRGREKILAAATTGKPLAEDVDLAMLARRTPGLSGADLVGVINEACMAAGRDYAEVVTATHFDSAVATIAMGKARVSAAVSDTDRRITACHEAGHTVAAMVLPDADNPVSVSIIPRGQAGGITWMESQDDLFLTRRRAQARLVVAMAGRAGEELLLDGEYTSGPHGDLRAATDTALAMVTQYGMTDTGLMIKSSGILATGAKVTDETVDAVETLLADALRTARAVLAAHRDLWQHLVDELLDADTLVFADLVTIGAQHQWSAPPLPPVSTVARSEAAARVRVAPAARTDPQRRTAPTVTSRMLRWAATKLATPGRGAPRRRASAE